MFSPQHWSDTISCDSSWLHPSSICSHTLTFTHAYINTYMCLFTLLYVFVRPRGLAGAKPAAFSSLSYNHESSTLEFAENSLPALWWRLGFNFVLYRQVITEIVWVNKQRNMLSVCFHYCNIDCVYLMCIVFPLFAENAHLINLIPGR